MSAHSEHDVSPKASLYFYGYFFLFVILLYLIITGLTIFFRAEVEHELYLKVGSVQSKDLVDQKSKELEQLKGIDEAMDRVVREAN